MSDAMEVEEAQSSSNSLKNQTGSNKRRVAYFYDAEVGNYHYGQGHPMSASS